MMWHAVCNHLMLHVPVACCRAAHRSRAASNRAAAMSAPANTKVKGGKRARNRGDDLTGVAGASTIEELVALFGAGLGLEEQ
jgi:hypothetical protein